MRSMVCPTMAGTIESSMNATNWSIEAPLSIAIRQTIKSRFVMIFFYQVGQRLFVPSAVLSAARFAERLSGPVGGETNFGGLAGY